MSCCSTRRARSSSDCVLIETACLGLWVRAGRTESEVINFSQVKAVITLGVSSTEGCFGVQFEVKGALAALRGEVLSVGRVNLVICRAL